ncbi:Uncharacterized protein Adt_04832 [Abeliophyllum distichum]|uniref:Uncharacterized protein n=1 Tax=Abeliophyllum distichum TaxID=126358 RepID=A0ABD1V2E4_9LAMI
MPAHPSLSLSSSSPTWESMFSPELFSVSLSLSLTLLSCSFSLPLFELVLSLLIRILIARVFATATPLQVVEAETAEASGVGSISVYETTESLDRVTARERVDIVEVVEEEAVAALEAERRARLVARWSDQRKKKKALLRSLPPSASDSVFLYKNPSEPMNRLAD